MTPIEPPKTLAEALEVIAKLLQRIEELEAKLNSNSQNSSRPPSSDAPDLKLPPKKEPSGRKPGGQPGHRGRTRDRLPPEEVDEVVDHYPGICGDCGSPLDESAYRVVVGEATIHQVTEIPKVKGRVTEHRLHMVQCARCEQATRAPWPAGVPRSSFGPRLHAVIAHLSGTLRLGKRVVAAAVSDLFSVRISVGAISASESAMSTIIEPAVAAAKRYVLRQVAVHADETSWRETRRRAWLWVAATALVTVFLIHARRGAVAARLLLDGMHGVLVTDRWSAYGGWSLARRQICWAHLKRDFQFLSERSSATSKEIGTELLTITKDVFRLWHRIRDGTLSRPAFRRQINPLRARVEALLRQGAVSHDARLSGMCLEMLKVESAFWTFVRVEGVEPTNNHAERSIRPAVLWRKNSFGTHSDQGSRFVERMLTVTVTLRQQGRNVLDYLAEACEAAAFGRPVPSILPLHRQKSRRRG